MIGLWFLIAEHLRLGSWELIKAYTGTNDSDIVPRIAMQVVNESSLCKNRVRRKNYIAHQGFELLSGLGFLATDVQVHTMLNNRTVKQAEDLQGALAAIRYNNGHFNGHVIAIDPHRIVSSTQRIMPKKKKQPTKPSEKMLQTFFALDTRSGQPIGCGIGSPGVNTTKATLDLVSRLGQINGRTLVIADKEHFTEALIRNIEQSYDFEFLVPVQSTERIKKIEQGLVYKRAWAGYALAETMFKFSGHKEKYRLICQREGETQDSYRYKSFLALSDRAPEELIAEIYRERWSIEEFFNSEGAMGFDRASTFNMNIRYGKMSLALVAQAACFQFKNRLESPISNWDAVHLSDSIFNSLDGDIKVKDDTIVVTCYNVPERIKLKDNYQNLPRKLLAEGFHPKIPWLYDLKLDFRFK